MRFPLLQSECISGTDAENRLLDLIDLSDLVAGSVSVKDAFRSAASRVCKFIGCDGARLYLWDRERDRLNSAADWGTVEQGSTGPDELTARCLLSKRIETIEQANSSASIPLTRGEEIIGVLKLFFNEPSKSIGPLASGLALVQDLVSPVIVNSLIYERSIARAHMDSVTELPNERAFHTALENTLAKARSVGGALSIVVIDIKDFATINETFGHVVGDMALRWVGQTVRHSLRDMDLIARTYCDEFLAVLPTASEQETLAIISRIEDAVAEADMPAELMGTQKIRLNFGWAVFSLDGDSPLSLIERARVRKDLSKMDPSTRNVLIFRPSQVQDRAV